MVGSIDDAQTRNVLTALAACVATTQEVTLAAGTAANPQTGQPVLRGNLLVAFGGPFFQKTVGYAEAQRSTPVYLNRTTAGVMQFVLASTSQVIAELPESQIGATHDLVVIELSRDPSTGTPMLFGYGIDASGTGAAAWYFTNVMAPSLATFDKSWYVFEWTDSGTVGPSDLTEFTPKTVN
jgi:hypothetical protein